MGLIVEPEVDGLILKLRRSIQAILGERLVGLYLYGSLVTGDFDPRVSDVDLLAVTASDIDEREFERLRGMHQAIAAASPAWDDRIEVAYLSAAALRTFRERASRIAVISPGEPFHFKEAGKDWLINWWVIRSSGVALIGPPPEALIDPISDEEFLRAVSEQVVEWQDWVEHMRRRGSQAYAILTMCRALYAISNRAQVSKLQAARWAQARFPQWAPLIERALAWRVAPDDAGVDHEATFGETVGFVRFTLAHIQGRA
ncbi:MAG: DUF4111 domain-containing protein [Chloroflexota bacterium]|nr:MAG: nucleotidyltransferase [Chloroflexota bacterium]